MRSRSDNQWFVVLFLAVALVVGVIIGGFAIHKSHEVERRDARSYCVMNEGLSDPYSAEFKNCVDQYMDDGPRDY